MCRGNIESKIELIITPTIEHNRTYSGNNSKQMKTYDCLWKQYGNSIITNDNTGFMPTN